MKTLRASFFSLLVNLNKIKCFTFSYCYTDLGVGCSTKEATGNFFREHFNQNHENTICVNFQFYNPKFHVSCSVSALQGNVIGALRTKQLTASVSCC